MRKPLSALSLSVITLAIAGCSEQQPAAAPLAPPPPAETAPVATQPAATAEAKEAPKPVELTPEQNAKVYQDCWAAFNAKDWAKFSPCYADNATSESVDMPGMTFTGKDIVEKGVKPFVAAFPDTTGEAQLTLVNGNNVVGVWLIRGTQKGPLATANGEIAPTNKKIGFLLGQSIELSGGKGLREQQYEDTRTMLGQLGVVPGPVRKVMDQGLADKPVVIAKNDDSEKANVEVYKKYADAFSKHDAAATDAVLADDFVFSDQTAPADLVGKKEATRGLKELWKGMTDVKLSLNTIWPAGEYVVSMGELTGTNDGPLPSMKLWKKTGKTVNVKYLSVAKLQSGKLKKQWIFGNGMAMADQLGLTPAPKGTAAKAAKADASKGGSTATAGTATAASKTAATGATSATAAPKATAPAAAPKQPAAPTPAAPKAAAPTTPAPAAPKK